jgi:NAD(P)-dependent dehydrogenase (short-subunit alcohol dehydrogenase family)
MRTIDLSGKAALITGGTRNIGRAIAQCLAEAGADVALFYRSDEEAATRAREEIRASTGRRAEVYRADVGDEAAVGARVENALADFGGAFPVVHNAGHGDGGGTMPPSGCAALRTDQWRGTLAVNLDAVFFLTRALLRRGGALPPGGSVVFIASGRGHDPTAGLASYGTAKAALIHFAAMLAQDVGPRGVRVNVVSPGFTDTDHAPEEDKPGAVARAALRRLGTPEDVAGAVLFFASEPLRLRHRPVAPRQRRRGLSGLRHGARSATLAP